MNFLAHLYFAAPEPEAVAGQLMGDFVKGEIPAELPAVVRDNIRLHRRIDGYTDAHDDVRRAKSLFRPPWRRYAGIVLDMYFDHLLSNHWRRFSDVPKHRYIRQLYALLARYDGPAPTRMRRVAALMIEHDWLSAYGNRADLDLALQRVGQRLRRPVALHQALPAVARHTDELDALFLQFFPQLIEEVARQR